MHNLLKQINDTANFIKSRSKTNPEIGLILGSGLGNLADEINDPTDFNYCDLPNFPVSTVEGHAGRLTLGGLENKSVIAMNGRFHYYEGYSMERVVYPVRVMKALGVKTIIVTNACGGLNKKMHAGAIMLINDHINFMGANPLIGGNIPELGPRFPDMSSAYDKDLLSLALDTAGKMGIAVFEGVYLAISGPCYLTKAELRMSILLGADAIGMSTVPEVIAAHHSNMKILGISCVTDMAIPDSLESISHSQVMEMAKQTQPRFSAFIKGILKNMD